ncbi:MAG TPA: polyprenyl synthetase family protein, partial [Gemmatimonadales bacterium]|nr:polyprenyl synthetase family protein [Gemmatimonadales bacterium]
MSSPVAPVTLAELQAPVRHELERAQRELRRIIEADFQLIRDVNAHLLQMQGKLFRPTIMLLSDQATGAGTAHATTLAAVVELIHLATLVHDDSVDHSVLRRGMPTINALFSHQISVIMGDYLYSRAVIELVRLNQFESLRVLSRVTNEMTVGEMRQLLAHDPLQFSEEQYDLLIRAKTASLLSGAAELGALAAPAPQRHALQRFGEALGMAFQIVDDLLDYRADPEESGKNLGTDLAEGKPTLPLIHVLTHGTPEQAALVRNAIQDHRIERLPAVLKTVESAGGI